MLVPNGNRSFFAAVSLLVGCLLSSGCGLNRQNVGNELSMQMEPAAGEFLVRMEFPIGEPKMHRGEIRGSMTVQDALVQSGATRRYRTMQITILREIPGHSRPVRLDVDYETSRKTVVESQNYAIHPGDRILIRPKDDNMISNLLNKATGL
ncbi:MAG TPA: hypothetical protein PKD64_05985 [Pirellulaceae bacterium]|nr:hypothetical protein [Pirellulaceae bacterium]HMO91729.1 hypothetical protein [Pirellulaceae bacterium]HMP69808.1 hypothetical protein [Pirellulaceae bacterium]